MCMIYIEICNGNFQVKPQRFGRALLEPNGEGGEAEVTKKDLPPTAYRSSRNNSKNAQNFISFSQETQGNLFIRISNSKEILFFLKQTCSQRTNKKQKAKIVYLLPSSAID